MAYTGIVGCRELRVPRGLFLAALAAVLFCVQPAAARGFDLSVGIKGGLESPFYSGPGYSDFLYLNDLSPPNAAVRFGAGLFLTLGLVDLLALQPELFYSPLGGVSGSKDYLLWTDKVPTLDAQLLIKLRFHLRGFNRFELFFGPQAVLKLGEVSLRMEDWWSYATGSWPDAYLEPFTLGAVAGIGWTFARGRNLFTIDVRYCHGLTSRMSSASGWGDWYQNDVQLLLGFGRQLAGSRTQGRPGRVR
jgi:hypothetical protein